MKRDRKKKLDLTGQRFGKWLVLTLSDVNHKHHKYLCRCDCGRECEVYQTHLVRGNTSKCLECSIQENSGNGNYKWKGCGEISGDLFDMIKGQIYRTKRAYRKNLEFSITIEYIWDLFLKQNRKCALSGIDIYFPKKHNYKGTASLDRIDSSKGYIPGNVQWVHKDINKMKNVFSQEYFVDMCKKIANKCELK